MGECPCQEIVIDKDGKVFFNGIRYTQKEGIFTSKISTEEFIEIRDKFRFGVLNENHKVWESDAQTVSAVLLCNDSIYFSLVEVTNTDLENAYTSLRYLEKSLKLKPIHYESLPNQMNYSYLGFKLGKMTWQFMGAESFLVYYNLSKATIEKINFIAKYELKFCNLKSLSKVYKSNEIATNKKEEPELRKITTDGQYYKFFMSDGNSFTLNIGFNFIERNQRFAKFKPDNQIKY